jgi:hypothetical protein
MKILTNYINLIRSQKKIPCIHSFGSLIVINRSSTTHNLRSNSISFMSQNDEKGTKAKTYNMSKSYNDIFNTSFF